MSSRISRLLHDAALSDEARSALSVCDLGGDIQAALGVCADDVLASEAVLVTMMPDDSASIAEAGNTQAVRDGHNAVLDALGSATRKDAVLAHTRYLNGTILQPYAPLASAARLDAHNYRPSLGTPLYDQSVVLLGTVIAKAQELLDAGIAVRTVTLIISDGADCGSVHQRPKQVAALVADMLRQERHIIAALGIDDGRTNFRRVFQDMGIPDRWILTPTNDAAEIRRAFQLFSRSAVQASSGSLGGFAP